MARRKAPVREIREYLISTKIMKKSGYIQQYYKWAPKRVYERIDGKFVGIGWKVQFYPFGHSDTSVHIKMVVLDSKLES